MRPLPNASDFPGRRHSGKLTDDRRAGRGEGLDPPQRQFRQKLLKSQAFSFWRRAHELVEVLCRRQIGSIYPIGCFFVQGLATAHGFAATASLPFSISLAIMRLGPNRVIPKIHGAKENMAPRSQPGPGSQESKNRAYAAPREIPIVKRFGSRLLPRS